MNEIPEYTVLDQKTIDCGLYRMYQERITIDDHTNDLMEILSIGKGIFNFPVGSKMCLRIDGATMQELEGKLRIVVIRDIYVEEKEKTVDAV